MLQFVSIPSSSMAHQSSTCIFLHGLGDSGNGWAQVAQVLSKKLPFTKFILPHAPQRKITLNGGVKMPGWYDITGLNESAPQDEAGILESARSVLELVKAEEGRGIPRNKIVIGGFSQGGAVALTAGLLYKHVSKEFESSRREDDFAGIIALSTYLPIHAQFQKAKPQLSRHTPIFMAHGTADQVIHYRWAQHSLDYMENELGCDAIQFETIKHMGHSVDPNEIESIGKFLRKTLKYADAGNFDDCPVDGHDEI